MRLTTRNVTQPLLQLLIAALLLAPLYVYVPQALPLYIPVFKMMGADLPVMTSLCLSFLPYLFIIPLMFILMLHFSPVLFSPVSKLVFISLLSLLIRETVFYFAIGLPINIISNLK